MDHSSFDKWIGAVIDGRYEVETVVGVGGMAYVLKAKDLRMGRAVAIKMLNEEFHNDERAVKRFINESKTVSMLDHPNIVKIYDVVISDECKYIVMEFIDGITLKDYMDSVGAIEWKEAIYYTKQVLAALTHAHKKGVMHRDIKPQNIMLLGDGKVKVTDFGIAKQRGAESITMTDKAIGTVNYISPEQASGKTVDFRTDIYSTGVMLYEMVTGRLPFTADSPVAVAMMQVQSTPTRPRSINANIPLGLEQIILKAMNKNADDRFVGAYAMERALDYFLNNPETVFAGEGIENGDPDEEKQRIKADKERAKEEKLQKKRYRGSRAMFPIIAGVALSFFVVLAGFGIYFFNQMKQEAGDAKNAREIVESGISPTIDRLLGVGSTSGDRNIEVVSFVGKEYNEDLLAEMNAKGFRVGEVKKVRDNDYGANTVTSQSPEGGEVRMKPEDGSLLPITLYVNLAENTTEMPNCTLLSVNEAKKMIRTQIGSRMLTEFAESSIKIVEEYHDTYPADYVIRTEPAYGDTVVLDGSAVFTLYVSMGQEGATTVVPALVGKTYDEARRALVEANLSIGRITYEKSEEYDTGKVIRASLEEGSSVAQKVTSVDLWVSSGKPEPEEEPKTPETPETVEQPETKPEPVAEHTVELTAPTVPDEPTLPDEPSEAFNPGDAD